MCWRKGCVAASDSTFVGTKTTPPANLPQVARSPQVEFLTKLRLDGKKSLPTGGL